MVGQLGLRGYLEALVPTAVFVLAASHRVVHLFGAAHKALLAGQLVQIEQASQRVGDGAQAEAVARVLAPTVAQKKFPGLVQNLPRPLVAAQVVIIHPIVDKGVRSARLVAKVVHAVAETAADHVGPKRVIVAGIYVQRMPGHGLGERVVAPLARAQVLQPHGVARIPFAVAPTPASLEAPAARALLPSGHHVAPIEKTLPAIALNVPFHPSDKARQHAVGTREFRAGRQPADRPALHHPIRRNAHLWRVQKALQLLVAVGTGAKKIDEKLAALRRARAVGIDPFALVPSHLLGVAFAAEPPAVWIAPKKHVDALRTYAEGLGVLLSHVAQRDANARAAVLGADPASGALTLGPCGALNALVLLPIEVIVQPLREQCVALGDPRPLHDPPCPDAPSSAAFGQERDAQAQFIHLGLARIAGNDHRVYHPHLHLVGIGIDPSGKAQRAIARVVVHGRGGLVGSSTANHRPQGTGLFYLDGVFLHAL